MSLDDHTAAIQRLLAGLPLKPGTAPADVTAATVHLTAAAVERTRSFRMPSRTETPFALAALQYVYP